MNQEDCKFLTIELFGEKEWHELIYEEVSSTWWCECGRASCLPCDNRTFDNWNDFGDVWNKMKENGKLKDWCAWLWEKKQPHFIIDPDVGPLWESPYIVWFFDFIEPIQFNQLVCDYLREIKKCNKLFCSLHNNCD